VCPHRVDANGPFGPTAAPPGRGPAPLVAAPSDLDTPVARHVRAALGAPSGDHPYHDRRFADLEALLPPDSHLVLNESRVVCARLLATVPGHDRPPPRSPPHHPSPVFSREDRCLRV